MPNTLYKRVEEALTAVQPMLGMHGGGVELVEITPENVVKIRFQGACAGCLAADQTLEFGIKEMLMIQIEEITDIIAINDEEKTHMPPSPLR